MKTTSATTTTTRKAADIEHALEALREVAEGLNHGDAGTPRWHLVGVRKAIRLLRQRAA